MITNRSPSIAPVFAGFAAPVREADGPTEVSLCGEIDLANASAIQAEVLQACAGPNRVVIVDLQAVTFMDACGIGACLSAQQLARERGRELVFSKPQGVVARVIAVLGLESVLLGAEPNE
jgi:anti-anti-sigma factor